MANPMRVALLYGGMSGEHEVSLISAAAILSNLDPERFEVMPVGMDKDGKSYLNEASELLGLEALPIKTTNSTLLPSLVIDGKFALEADVVFPIAHGPLYEDGCLQGMLKLADIPFVGCDVISSSIGMDKDLARRLVGLAGIESANYRVLPPQVVQANLEGISSQLAQDLGLPLFVKPCSMGSSVGIHKAKDLNELSHAIKDAGRFDTQVVIEACVQGREVELAVLEAEFPHLEPLVSLPGEIKVSHPDGYYSYHAKYIESNLTELVVPAKIEPSLIAELQEAARTIFTTLKCKGMARVDFFVDDKTGQLIFNEINTMPGFTPISMYPKLWEVSGIAYSDLLEKLVQLAIADHRARKQLVTHYQ